MNKAPSATAIGSLSTHNARPVPASIRQHWLIRTAPRREMKLPPIGADSVAIVYMTAVKIPIELAVTPISRCAVGVRIAGVNTASDTIDWTSSVTASATTRSFMEHRSRALRGAKCLVDVPENVVDVLDADRQPDHVRRDACLDLLF